MSDIRHKLMHELRELIPVTLFFLTAFLMLALTQTLLLAEHGIRGTTFAAAAIGALVVAKVVVIADHFSWVDRFPRRPLVYNVIWKTAIYFVASFGVRYAEHFVRLWGSSDGFADANHKLFDEIVWPHFWCVQMWLLALLLVYCTLRELIRAIGRDRLIAMFFRLPPAVSDSLPPLDQITTRRGQS